MNCEEVEELLGVYALGALTHDAVLDVEFHLASCTKHDDLPELRALARSLMFAAPEVEPPPRLKMRLMAAVRRDLAPASEAPARRRLVDWLKVPLSVRPAYAIDGALAAAAVAIIVFALLLNGGGDESAVFVGQLTGTTGASGQIVYEDRNLTIAVQDLAAPPAEMTYQIWAVRNGSATSLGFLDSLGDTSFADLQDVDLRKGDTVAITVEPAGGSDQPTTAPILEAHL